MIAPTMHMLQLCVDSFLSITAELVTQRSRQQPDTCIPPFSFLLREEAQRQLDLDLFVFAFPLYHASSDEALTIGSNTRTRLLLRAQWG